MAAPSYSVGYPNMQRNVDLLFEKGVAEFFFEGEDCEGMEAIYEQIFNVQTMSKRTIYKQGLIGISDPLKEMQHGEEIPDARMNRGYPTEFTAKKYGKTIGIDVEAFEDDMVGVFADIPRQLGRAVRNTKEMIAADIFNRAFTTATLSSGQPILSANHPLVSGGVTSNILATPADPSYNTWSALNALLLGQKDEFGLPCPIMNSEKIWMVSEEFYADALQAVGSTTATTIGVAVNPNSGIINPWQGGAKVLMNPWLTDKDASFLLVKGQIKNGFWIRKEAVPVTYSNPDPEVINIKATGRYVAGFWERYGIVGTPGI